MMSLAILILAIFFVVSAVTNGVLIFLMVLLAKKRKKPENSALTATLARMNYRSEVIDQVQKMKPETMRGKAVVLGPENIKAVFDQMKKTVPHVPPAMERIRITNYTPNISIPMMILKMDPSFENDPNFTNPLVNPAILGHATAIAAQMDEFIRKQISKIFNEFSLGIFIDTRSAIPNMDVEMLFASPSKCLVTVVFRQKVLGRAMFDSHVEETPAGAKLVSKITELEVQPDEVYHNDNSIPPGFFGPKNSEE